MIGTYCLNVPSLLRVGSISVEFFSCLPFATLMMRSLAGLRKSTCGEKGVPLCFNGDGVCQGTVALFDNIYRGGTA